MANTHEMKHPSLGILIQTYNESHNIDDCVKSALRLSKNILIVDTQSTDDTRKKAKKYPEVHVTSFPYHRYVEPSRQFGIDSLKTDWIFILDADERLSAEVIKEIHAAIQNPEYTHYKLPRLNFFKRTIPLKHGGWYPDRIIRLVKKDAFIKWPKEVHSTPAIEGRCGELSEPFFHYSQDDLGVMVSKTTLFEDVESDLLVAADRDASTAIFFRKFLGELNRRLIQKAGYRDGLFGNITSLYQAFSKTITYLYVYEKKQKSTHH